MVNFRWQVRFANTVALETQGQSQGVVMCWGNRRCFKYCFNYEHQVEEVFKAQCFWCDEPLLQRHQVHLIALLIRCLFKRHHFMCLD